ncbi:hypothetical protein [Rhodovulum sp. YEN HP10]|uniref:hypothetical protein n=1 Tax=Rhodovulum sp. HP10 TaxID=3387397 RepID=UPI0039DF6A99
MPKNRACANAFALPSLALFRPEHDYLTGNNPRALWQRFRLWRAYSRPVTFRDLRRVAYDANRTRPSPCAQALFDRICREAERSVIG